MAGDKHGAEKTQEQQEGSIGQIQPQGTAVEILDQNGAETSQQLQIQLLSLPETGGINHGVLHHLLHEGIALELV